MSICLYKVVGAQYFYAVEVGMPEAPIQLGEADSPAGAVRAMDGTPFQSAMTSCGFPSNSHFPSLFRSLIGGRPGEIEVEDPSEEDAAEAQAEYDRMNSGDEEYDEDEDEDE